MQEGASAAQEALRAREQYGFCESRYGWYSFTSSFIPGFGGTTDERSEAGGWSVIDAVADPGRRKAVGRLQLNPENAEPRVIEVAVDEDGADNLGGYEMQSQPLDCGGG